MNSRKIQGFSILLCILLCIPLFSFAQANPTAAASQTDIDTLKKSAAKVFIDCDSCDIEYIKNEITYVNYVRDRKEAQVHVLITLQSTGAGGVEYTITFSGQQEFQGMDDIQKFVSNITQTEDQIRQGLVRVLKMGLMRYVAKTPIADKVAIVFQEKVNPTAVVDKWKLWVFSLSARSYLSGEKSTSSNYLYGSVSANRITPEWKIQTSIYVSRSEDSFTIDDQTISSVSNSKSFSGLIVKSLGEHWSVGVFLSASSSTYSNIKFSLQPAPAIEYDLFPYSQSTRRQLRFLYRINFKMMNYREATIYDKMSENLWSESLYTALVLKEKWGTISTSLEASHYFHDFKKNHVELNAEISLRLFKGLSFDVYGSYSMIHDQLSLPKGQAAIEQILLRRIMLETNYSYYAMFGLSYTFGSIYSNVVNPRFSGLY